MDRHQSLTEEEKPLKASNVVVIYQDLVTWKHAMELWDRISDLLGDQVVRCASWSIEELSTSEATEKAAVIAAQADVIVIAVWASRTLPPGLWAWIDAWLPSRREGDGALIASIGRVERSPSPSDQARQYLQTIAHRARLDFLVQEYLSAQKTPLPLASQRR